MAGERVSHRPFVVVLVSLVSLGFGGLATVALFVRMLEKKIKWMTRLIILGSWSQGLFAGLAFVLFRWLQGVDGGYSEAVTYNVVASVASLVAAGLLTYHHHTNQTQWYSYTLYELSLAQRQLTLLMISSLFYLALSATLYGYIEGWKFDDALYWSITTYTTVGFGDFAPRTTAGRGAIPIVTAVGIGLIGGLIWSLRNVVLEVLTLQLATQYSKQFGQQDSMDQSATNSPAISSPAASLSVRARQFGARFNLLRRGKSIGDFSSSDRVPLLRDDELEHTNRSSELFIPSSGVLSVYDSASPSSNNKRKRPQTMFAAGGPSNEGFTSSPLSSAPSSPSLDSADIRPISIAAFDNDHVPPPSLLPLGRYNTTTIAELAAERQRKHTMTISRAEHLPHLTIVADAPLMQQQVEDVTRSALQFQIIIGSIIVVGNLVIFGTVFAWLEKWTIWEGIYFAYITGTTIGYGDLTLCTNTGRSLLIWYIFIAIGSTTYLGSMGSELALNQWTVTVDHIEKRVGRYEKKAQFKKLYGGRKGARKSNNSGWSSTGGASSSSVKKQNIDSSSSNEVLHESNSSLNDSSSPTNARSPSLTTTNQQQQQGIEFSHANASAIIRIEPPVSQSPVHSVRFAPSHRHMALSSNAFSAPTAGSVLHRSLLNRPDRSTPFQSMLRGNRDEVIEINASDPNENSVSHKSSQSSLD